MSDLQCPARIVVARHGEAGYARPDVLSDDGGWLTERGQAQARDLGERLRDAKVAALYTSTMSRAAETGRIVATVLGVPTSTAEGVHELSLGDLAGRPDTDREARRIFLAWLSGSLGERVPGGQTGSEVVARFRAAVDEIADRHRGETVVLVSHGGVMSLAIPHTATNVGDDLSRNSLIDNCAVVTVEVDADGWRMVGPWPGRPWNGAAKAEVSEEAGPDVVDAP